MSTENEELRLRVKDLEKKAELALGELAEAEERRLSTLRCELESTFST